MITDDERVALIRAIMESDQPCMYTVANEDVEFLLNALTAALAEVERLREVADAAQDVAWMPAEDIEHQDEWGDAWYRMTDALEAAGYPSHRAALDGAEGQG